MTSSAISPNSSDGNEVIGIGYEPGNYYNIGDGITKAEWEGPLFYKAIPAQDRFVRETSAVNDVALLANLTGEPLNFVQSLLLFDDQFEQFREDQLELNSRTVDPACAAHFSAPPHCFKLSFKTESVASNGEVQFQSYITRTLTYLTNKTVHFFLSGNGARVLYQVQNTGKDGFVIVKNDTNKRLFVEFSVNASGVKLNSEENDILKKERTADYGGNVVARALIVPKGAWHYDASNKKFIVRLVEPPTLQYPGYQKPNPYIKYRVPGSSNYVVAAWAEGTAGYSFVAVYGDPDRQSFLLLGVPTSTVKLVIGNIVFGPDFDNGQSPETQ